MAELHCTITTPERLVFDGEVRLVVVPAADGELGVLKRHAPLVGALGFGELRVTSLDAAQSNYFVDGGFVQVADNKLTVLAAEAVAVEELDAAAAEETVRNLESSPPASGASGEERETYARDLAAARKRLRLVKT